MPVYIGDYILSRPKDERGGSEKPLVVYHSSRHNVKRYFLVSGIFFKKYYMSDSHDNLWARTDEFDRMASLSFTLKEYSGELVFVDVELIESTRISTVISVWFS